MQEQGDVKYWYLAVVKFFRLKRGNLTKVTGSVSKIRKVNKHFFSHLFDATSFWWQSYFHILNSTFISIEGKKKIFQQQYLQKLQVILVWPRERPSVADSWYGLSSCRYFYKIDSIWSFCIFGQNNNFALELIRLLHSEKVSIIFCTWRTPEEDIHFRKIALHVLTSFHLM